MISIICPVTNNNIFDNMLSKSLKKQTNKEHEIIKLDSRKLGFSNASETLNYGASISKGDILVFIHQDIELLDINILKKIENYCSVYNFAMAGVCGVEGTGKYKVTSSVTIGKNHRQAGRKLLAPENSYVLDECMLIVKKKDFIPFENLGDTWHFYAVDYCLRAQRMGQKVMIFPLEIYHLSPGWSLNYDYFDRLISLAKKYEELPYICTCMGVFKNNLSLPLYCSYRKMKLLIKNILHYQRKE